MTGTLLPVPTLRAVDSNGVPMSGALLQFYLTGTTTPTPVYTSATLGTPLSNPVVSDSAGLFPAIYIDPTITYRAQLKTSGGSLVRRGPGPVGLRHRHDGRERRLGDLRNRNLLAMSGAVILTAGMAQTAGGGGTVIPNPLEWTDAFGSVVASTNVQTVSGISVPISVLASKSGGGVLHYAQNGTGAAYVGPILVNPGDTLVWTIFNVGSLSVSGTITITITNGSDGGAVLDAPSYTATGSS